MRVIPSWVQVSSFHPVLAVSIQMGNLSDPCLGSLGSGTQALKGT